MRFDIITVLPSAFDYLNQSVLGRAQKNKKISIKIHNLHDWAKNKYKTVDDSPYGGGVGLVMKPDIAFDAIESIKAISNSQFTTPQATPSQQLRSSAGRQAGGQAINKKESKILQTSNSKLHTILVTPQGKPFKQADAKRLSKYNQIIILAGRFEGYDERIRSFVDEEISLGDFVLTGGELPAMAIVDAVSRKISGVLGKDESGVEESFEDELLEYPHFTRPEVFSYKLKAKAYKLVVPRVLLSGNHAEIKKWRQEQALLRTKKRRPDLIKYLKAKK